MCAMTCMDSGRITALMKAAHNVLKRADMNKTRRTRKAVKQTYKDHRQEATAGGDRSNHKHKEQEYQQREADRMTADRLKENWQQSH